MIARADSALGGHHVFRVSFRTTASRVVSPTAIAMLRTPPGARAAEANPTSGTIRSRDRSQLARDPPSTRAWTLPCPTVDLRMERSSAQRVSTARQTRIAGRSSWRGCPPWSQRRRALSAMAASRDGAEHDDDHHHAPPHAPGGASRRGAPEASETPRVIVAVPSVGSLGARQQLAAADRRPIRDPAALCCSHEARRHGRRPARRLPAAARAARATAADRDARSARASVRRPPRRLRKDDVANHVWE